MVSLVVIILLIVAGIIWYASTDKDSTTTTTESVVNNANTAETIANTNTPASPLVNTNAQVNTNSPTLNGQQGQFSGEPGVDGPDTSVFEIKYDGSKFTPSTLDIKAGDVVIFKNESSKSFRPASGPHPSHTNYPEFDPKKEIPAGGSWQFTFEKTGSWPFHDHLNSSVFGKINVTK